MIKNDENYEKCKKFDYDVENYIANKLELCLKEIVDDVYQKKCSHCDEQMHFAFMVRTFALVLLDKPAGNKSLDYFVRSNVQSFREYIDMFFGKYKYNHINDSVTHEASGKVFYTQEEIDNETKRFL